MKITNDSQLLKLQTQLKIKHFDYFYRLTENEILKKTGLKMEPDVIIEAVANYMSNELNGWVHPQNVYWEPDDSGPFWKEFSNDLDNFIKLKNL